MVALCPYVAIHVGEVSVMVGKYLSLIFLLPVAACFSPPFSKSVLTTLVHAYSMCTYI